MVQFLVELHWRWHSIEIGSDSLTIFDLYCRIIKALKILVLNVLDLEVAHPRLQNGCNENSTC